MVGREDRDAEVDGIADAADFLISISRSHCDVGDDSLGDQLVDSGEGRNVAFASGFKTDLDVVVFPSVGHFTILKRGREDDLGNHVAVVDFDVFHSVHKAGRIHGDGELEGATDAGVAIVNQGRRHGEVSHDSLVAFVDGGEGGDVAVTFSGQADGGVVIGPVVGDFAFAFSDLAVECDSGGGSLVADHLAFRLVHLHIEDLELAIADADFQARGVGGTDDETGDGQVVDADHAGAFDLEGEDGAFVAGIISLFKVECRHFELVAGLHVTRDGPAVGFSAFAEGQGARHKGQVFTKIDNHLGTGHVVVVGQVNRDGDDVVEVTIIIRGDGDSVLTGLHIHGVDGDVKVGHDKLPRFGGDGCSNTVRDIGDALDAKARVGSRQHLDDGVVEPLVLGIGSQGAIDRIHHSDVVEAEEEGAAHKNILTRHGENVRSASFDIDLIAVPGKGTQTIAVVRSHIDSDFIIFSRVGDTTEGAVLDGGIGNVVSLRCILEEHAVHVIAVVRPNHGAHGVGGVDPDEVVSGGRSLPPVEGAIVPVESHGLGELGSERQTTNQGAVPIGGVDTVQIRNISTEGVENRIQLTVIVDGHGDPAVATGLHAVDRIAGTVIHVDGVQDSITQTIHGLRRGVIGQLSHRDQSAVDHGDLA